LLRKKGAVLDSVLSKFEKHIDFSYSCFDRVVLRGYFPNLFVEGCVINLLGNFVNPLLSKRNKAAIKELSNNPSKIEQAYSIIDSALTRFIHT
jgi:hypothetical protein